MKTHVDTAAAIQLADTDLFLMRGGGVGMMCPDTLFLEEDADQRAIETWLGEARRAAPDREPEIVRVTRVIDVVT